VTGALPGPAEDLLRWCVTTGARLSEAAERAGALAAAIAADWPDGHGQEWSERAGRAGRDLDAAAADAARLAHDLQAPDDGTALGRALLQALGGTAAGERGHGPQLGGTDGARTDDERGMRVPELPG
jgi:hypothetical protein